MREHPIPQDITGYRFHLVGSMTLKQFAEILVGSIIALIFFKSGLPGIIRWPAIILFAGTGVLAAFVPFEERPLDHWITTFFQVMFKPTKFYWKREPKIPDAFTYVPQDRSDNVDSSLDLTPTRKTRIYQYLQSINQPFLEEDSFDIEEQKRISGLLNSFQTVQITTNPDVEINQQSSKPDLKVRVRKIQKMNNKNVQSPQNSSTVVYDKQTEQTIAEEGYEKQTASIQTEEVATATKQKKTSEPVVLPLPPKIDAPFPLSGTQLNQVGGIVLSSSDELIEDALIEIKSSEGSTITATNSNSLGQFLISGHLKSGEYELHVSSPSQTFNPVKITLTGEKIEPLEIRAVG